MTFEKNAICIAVMAGLLAACGGEQSEENISIEPLASESSEEGIEREAVYSLPEAAPKDQYTYSNYDEVRVTHADLRLDLNFETKTIDATAVLDLKYLDSDANKVVLDANDLLIKSIQAKSENGWTDVEFSLGPDDPLKGSRLEIGLAERADQIRIDYQTSPGAEGLQWLSPEQTAGKEHPFLFTQFQMLNARTMIPLQDTPAVRMTYKATVKTPPALLAVMSAAQDPDGERDGEYVFDMPQPIPSYLIALAVGDFEFQAINDHMGVYAERYILAQSAAEFEDTPLMEEAIDKLYGPYLWGRYDMIVLPPSFPYGGMENPRISFLTPTLIAGDKSLTNVVAHELAHSWSGNLVTNSTWRDAWLNEGFTSYVENRVMEALYGEERAAMERALDLEKLKDDVEAAERPELTALKMPADMEDPNDAFSQVSYAGGMFFLFFLEDRFGREEFDAFLRRYFEAFAFKSLTTEEFLPYFEDNLWATDPDAVTKAEIDAWIYEPGIPDTLVVPVSDAFERVDEQRKAWVAGEIALNEIDNAAWSTHEWLHFINMLPEDLTQDQFDELEKTFALNNNQNAEIAYAWYMKAISGGYEPAFENLKAFLTRVGRGKFIYKLYQGLIDHDRREWAADVYEKARPGYHPIAQTRIDGIFADEAN